MPITQKNIAERAGVSQPLVGMALRGKGNMKEETRRTVLKIAQELGYSSSASGDKRALPARRNGTAIEACTLAVLFQDPSFAGDNLRTLPFFVPFFSGLEDEARRRGHEIAYFACRPGELPRLVREGHVDGAICIQSLFSIAHLRELDLPVLALDNTSSQAISLVPDDADGTLQATRHLIENGHRHIAYLSWPLDFGLTTDAAHDRAHGYRRALREAKLPFDEALFIETRPFQRKAEGAEAVAALLERGVPFTGLVCYNDVLAMGAVEELQRRGKRVPEDVSVFGFDDISPQYHFQPALSSLGFDREAMARRAVAILCEEIQSANFSPRREVFPVKLVARQTTRAVTLVGKKAV